MKEAETISKYEGVKIVHENEALVNGEFFDL